MKKFIYSVMSVLLTCVVVMGNGVSVHAEAEECDYTSPLGNNIMVEVSGTRSTIGDAAALRMIDQYRYHACREHEVNPDDTKTTLSLSVDYGDNPTDQELSQVNGDYVPVNWSNELEHIAELRATEASIYESHTRPSYHYDVKFNDQYYTHYECLAWTSGSMSDGLSAFASERGDWISQNTSKETGHYTAMISPSNTYAGASSFTYGPDLDNKTGSLTTALEIGPAKSYNYTTSARNENGTISQKVEVDPDIVSDFGFKCKEQMDLNKTMSMQTYATVEDTSGSTTSWPVISKQAWASTDESVLVPDGSGNVVSKNKRGDAEVQCYALGKVYRKAIKVDHIWDKGTVTKQAGCTSKGTRTFKCKECGDTMKVSIPMNKNNHLHVKLIHKKAPKGNKPGYTGDAYCTDCNKIVKKGVYYKKSSVHLKVTVKKSKNSLILSWKKVKGATSYTIYKDNKKFKKTKLTKYHVKSLKKGKTYRFYVIANKGKKTIARSDTIKRKFVKVKISNMMVKMATM